MVMAQKLGTGLYSETLLGVWSWPVLFTCMFAANYYTMGSGASVHIGMGFLAPVGDGFNVAKPHIVQAFQVLRDEMLEVGEDVVLTAEEIGENVQNLLVGTGRTVGRTAGALFGGFVEEAPEGVAEFGQDVGQAITGGTQAIFYTVAAAVGITIYLRFR